MNLTGFSDRKILTDIKMFRRIESETLIKILYRLAEIDRRRLYSDLKYGSLFEYAVGELRYSEPAATRRISTMKVLKEIPETEDKIKSGSLSLSNIAMAQTMFSKEKKVGRPLSKTQKQEVLAQLENQSTRAAQEILRQHSPEMNKPVGLEYKNIQNEDLRKIISDLRGSVAHTDPQISLEDLLLKICKGEIGKGEIVETSTPASEAQHVRSNADQYDSLSIAAARREVWRRDKSKCVNCESTYAVEIDHILPVAAGGPSTLENMRLLCRSCNQRVAIKFYGACKMASHLSERKTEYRCG